MKRKIAMFMSAILISSVALTGCGGSNEEASNNGSDTVVNEDGDEVTELTVHGMYGDSFIGDYSLPVTEEIQKEAGVKLVNTVAPSTTNEDQAWTLMMSVPDQMPDILTNSSIQKIEKLGMDGGCIPLEDLIDEYAPNIQAYFEKYPEAKAASTAADGHIYQVACIKEMKTAETWIIRKDWLDKLGLEVPETTDDLYNVLTAFATEDPNGNGVQDETPFISRSGANSLNDILSLWGSSTQMVVRDGKVVYDPYEPDFKIAMENAIKWYDEGLIDPEIFTRGGESRNVMYGEDKGGFICDWPASTTQYNLSLAETVPGFENVVIAPPIDQNGNQIAYHVTTPGAGPAISSNCDDPVAAIKFIDFMYSPEGILLNSYGIEGLTFEYDENGQPQFTDLITDYPDGIPAGRTAYGMQCRLGSADPLALEYVTATNDQVLEGWELYSDHPEWYSDDTYLNYVFKYTPEEQQEIDLILTDLNAYVQEKCISWILGTGDFESEYDQFISELELRNVERAVEISQAAYDRTKAE